MQGVFPVDKIIPRGIKHQKQILQPLHLRIGTPQQQAVPLFIGGDSPGRKKIVGDQVLDGPRLPMGENHCFPDQITA